MKQETRAAFAAFAAEWRDEYGMEKDIPAAFAAFALKCDEYRRFTLCGLWMTKSAIRLVKRH